MTLLVMTGIGMWLVYHMCNRFHVEVSGKAQIGNKFGGKDFLDD